MLHPSTKRLIDKLDEMTRRQRVAWVENENGQITHETEGYRVAITAAPHSVLLTDARGRQIETCTPDDFAGDTDAAGRPYSEFVADLYREGNRHARGAERAISTLLESLDADDTDEPAALIAEPDVAEPEIADAEPETPIFTADEVDTAPDEEVGVETASEEVEGEADMQRAVAEMADVVNGGTEEEAEHPEPAGMAVEAAPEPDDEPPSILMADLQPSGPDEPPSIIAAELAREAAAEAEAAATADFDPDWAATADTAESVIGSTYEETGPEQPEEAEEEVATEIEAQPQWTPEAPIEAPAEAETFASDYAPFGSGEPAEPEWMPEPEVHAEDVAPEPEPVPEPKPAPPVEAPAQERAPIFGSGILGGSMSDLSRYRSPPAPEPATTVSQEAVPEPEPVAEPEPQPPSPPTLARPISLSGITSGFGLGAMSASRPAFEPAPELEPEPAPEPEPEAVHAVIDGTADLPDEFAPPPEEPAAPTPGFTLEARPDDDFGFTDDDLMPDMTPEPQPEPQAADAASQEPAPESPAPRKARRFNPWN